MPERALNFGRKLSIQALIEAPSSGKMSMADFSDRSSRICTGASGGRFTGKSQKIEKRFNHHPDLPSEAGLYAWRQPSKRKPTNSMNQRVSYHLAEGQGFEPWKGY